MSIIKKWFDTEIDEETEPEIDTKERTKDPSKKSPKTISKLTPGLVSKREYKIVQKTYQMTKTDLHLYQRISALHCSPDYQKYSNSRDARSSRTANGMLP